MQDLINSAIAYLFVLADTCPNIALVLSAIGCVVVVATIAKPAVLFVVKRTKTEKDDAFVQKFYDIIEGTAFDFAPYIALFKKRNPKTAKVLEKVEKVVDK